MIIFKNKFWIKLIAAICLFCVVLNFPGSTTVYARRKPAVSQTNETNEEGEATIAGGVLLTPVMQLLSGIGDAIMDILHLTILEQEQSLIRLDGSADNWWNRHGASVLGWLAAIVVVAVVVLTVIPSGGASAAVGAGVLAKIGAACFIVKTAAVAIAAGTVSGFLVARVVDSAMMGDDIYLPVYRVTPEEIFANKIPLFDVNFFNPKPSQQVTQYGDPVVETITLYSDVQEYDLNDLPTIWIGTDLSSFNEKEIELTEENLQEECIKYVIDKANASGKINTITANSNYKLLIKADTEYSENEILSATTHTAVLTIKNAEGNKIEELTYTNMQTISTSSRMILETITTEQITTPIISTKDINSTAAELQGVVSQWYYILRNLALLVLMLVLIYTGIKIVTSSTAGEKAKYKERLTDWLVAMCLIFILHYIMIFAVELNEKIIELIDYPSEEQAVVREIVLSNENHINAINKDNRLSQYLTEKDGYQILEWGTDLMGGMRIEQQLVYEGTANWIGYVLCFLVLVIYTLTFSWTYLKRVLYMAFLTIIAPLVAMTYPIDKMTDGKAQAFNAWLKEYIFNLLMQPFHLLLYVILIGSAYELAGSNPLYAVVAIGFMTPAEKLLRKFFGFNKAQTPGALGGAAGTALAMTGLKSLMKFGSKGKGGGATSEDEDSKDSSKIKYSSSNGVNPKEVVAGSVEEHEEESQTSETEQTEETEGTPKLYENSGSKPIPQEMQQQQISSSEEKKKITKENKKTSSFKRSMMALGSGIGAYRRGLGNKLYKRIKKGRPIRAMARGMAGLAGATAFGMAGLALGIASGNPSKAFQYATAGATGGLGLGKGLAGRAVDAITVDSEKIKDEMEMEYYGDEYKKMKLQQDKVQMQHDDSYINYIRATLGVSRGEAERILEKTGGECFDSGIRQVEDIAAIEQMTRDSIEEEVDQWIEENGEELSELAEKEKEQKIEEVRSQLRAQMEDEERKHAIAMKKFSDRTPDLTKLGEKKIESYRSQFKKEMQKEFYDILRRQGRTDEEATQKAEQMAKDAADSIIEGIIKFDDSKSKILKA